jgi:hypothetical protein
MAISTYAELQTAVQTYLDDTSLSSLVPDWVTLGESRINRDVDKARLSWTNGSLTGTPSSRSVALPSTFVEARSLFLTTSGEQIELAPFIAGVMELRTSDGTPRAWSINGSNIDLDCPCDQAHTFLLRYRAKWAIATDLTNWLLTNHPDVYLFATLVEAHGFRGNEEQSVKYEVRYRNAVDEVNRKEARNETLVPLRVDAALLPDVYGSFNYTIGE